MIQNCKICGGAHYILLYSGYVTCSICKTIRSVNSLSEQQAVTMYAGYGLPTAWDDQTLDGMLCRRDTMLKRLKHFLPTNKPRNVLDIGCGWGGFIRNASKAGYTMFGSDVGAGVESASRWASGIFKGECYESKFFGFDASVLNHTLEHTIDPVRVLKWINWAMMKDGFVFVSVPNFNSLMSQTLGASWGWLEPNMHQWQFTTLTLGSLLARCGFKVEEITTENERGAYHWPDIEAKAKEFGIDVDMIDRLGLSEELYAVARKL